MTARATIMRRAGNVVGVDVLMGVTWAISAKHEVGCSDFGRASTSCWMLARYSLRPLWRSSRKGLENEYGSSSCPRHCPYFKERG